MLEEPGHPLSPGLPDARAAHLRTDAGDLRPPRNADHGGPPEAGHARRYRHGRQGGGHPRGHPGGAAGAGPRRAHNRRGGQLPPAVPGEVRRAERDGAGVGKGGGKAPREGQELLHLWTDPLQTTRVQTARAHPFGQGFIVHIPGGRDGRAHRPLPPFPNIIAGHGPHVPRERHKRYAGERGIEDGLPGHVEEEFARRFQDRRRAGGLRPRRAHLRTEGRTARAHPGGGLHLPVPQHHGPP